MNPTMLIACAFCAGLALPSARAAALQHDHDHDNRKPAAPAVPGDLVPLERGGPPSRERFTDWAERDSEGRWALWTEDLRRRGPEAMGAWIPFLIAEREVELLERLVLTRTAFEPAEALWKLGADNALRATAWLLADRENRTRHDARTALERRAAAFLSWEKQHQAAVERETHELADELRALRDEMNDSLGGSELASGQRGPLSAAELYGALAGALDCVPFGNRLHSEDGVVYDQAVLRAVATAQGRRDGGGPSVRAMLLAAARSDDAMVARLSMLAFTHMTPTLIPVRELAALAEDSSLNGPLRDTALLSASYGPWPAASLILHRHALGDPNASTWRVAWSRLVERGDAFTLFRVEAVPIAAGLAQDPAGFRSDRLRTLIERLDARRDAADDDGRGWLAQHSTDWLERLALATLWDDPQRTELERWTFDVLAAPGDDLRPHLVELGRSYASELEPEDPAARSVIEEFVRQWARDLAAG